MICKQYTLLHWKCKCTEYIVIDSVIRHAKEEVTTILCVASVCIKPDLFQWTFINMCNKVCHTVGDNALTVNGSLIFKPKRQSIIHLFWSFFITIKDKTNISLMFNILHLRQGSFTRKVRTNFTLKIIVSMFVKLFMILVLHLRQCFIVIFFVKRTTDWLCLHVLILLRGHPAVLLDVHLQNT